MRKILIATHGYFAEGVKSSIGILTGEDKNISYISAYVEGTNLDQDIDLFFKGVSDEDEVIIFTDIMGGSVTQKLMPYCRRTNVHLITGFNLSVILEIMFMSEPILKEDVINVVLKCRNQLIYVNTIKDHKGESEDFF